MLRDFYLMKYFDFLTGTTRGELDPKVMAAFGVSWVRQASQPKPVKAPAASGSAPRGAAASGKAPRSATEEEEVQQEEEDGEGLRRAWTLRQQQQQLATGVGRPGAAASSMRGSPSASRQHQHAAAVEGHVRLLTFLE